MACWDDAWANNIVSLIALTYLVGGIKWKIYRQVDEGKDQNSDESACVERGGNKIVYK